jgi:hypothetical protein
LLIAAPATAQNYPLKDKRHIKAPGAPGGQLQRQAQKRQVDDMTRKVQERARGMLRTKRPWSHKFKVYKRWARRKANRFRQWRPFRFKHNRHHVVTSARNSRRFRPWLSRQALRIRNRFMSSRLNRLRQVEGRRLRLPRGLGGLWRDMRNAITRQRPRAPVAPLNFGFSQLP